MSPPQAPYMHCAAAPAAARRLPRQDRPGAGPPPGPAAAPDRAGNPGKRRHCRHGAARARHAEFEAGSIEDAAAVGSWSRISVVL